MLGIQPAVTKFITGKTDGMDAKVDNNGTTKTPKALSAMHANKLEHRIKMELIEQGKGELIYPCNKKIFSEKKLLQ